jgi:hypothetical protein
LYLRSHQKGENSRKTGLAQSGGHKRQKESHRPLLLSLQQRKEYTKKDFKVEEERKEKKPLPIFLEGTTK